MKQRSILLTMTLLAFVAMMGCQKETIPSISVSDLSVENMQPYHCINGKVNSNEDLKSVEIEIKDRSSNAVYSTWTEKLTAKQRAVNFHTDIDPADEVGYIISVKVVTDKNFEFNESKLVLKQ